MESIFKRQINMGKSMQMLSLFVCVVMLCLTACNQTKEENQTMGAEEIKQEEEKENDKNEEVTLKEEENLNQLDGDDSAQEVVAKSVSINVYVCNDDATAFVTEKMQIDSLSPDEVLAALIEKGAIVSDVQVLRFETTTLDGKSTICLDLNDAFSHFVSSMGTTGEYYAIGSICNTFLNAYNCEQIQITVEGDTLVTGHAEYSGYMTIFS